MQGRRELRCADPKLDVPRNVESIDDHGHLVQFYESDTFLAESVRDFMVPGLERGEAVVIVATKEHRQAIDQLLEATDFDLQAFRNEGRYVLLDAAETLSRFLVDGEPEPALFSAAVGSQVASAAEKGTGVRIFGEMVALLWEDGNVAAALRLEELWNDLAERLPFALLCGYRMTELSDPAGFKKVCSLHARVIPTESYTGIEDFDARMRAISDLQQQAVAQAEERHRHALRLNDEIVQGLAAAKMAFDLEAYDVLETSLTETLDRATRLVSSLMNLAPEGKLAPGTLRKDSRTS
jgi:signal transduction histidine kinase